MEGIVSLEFTYRAKTYYALMRAKKRNGETHHYITVMNGELERLLFGHHIFIECDGCLQLDHNSTDQQVLELRNCIATALSRRFEVPEPVH